jgi:hypothetical protein
MIEKIFFDIKETENSSALHYGYFLAKQILHNFLICIPQLYLLLLKHEISLRYSFSYQQDDILLHFFVFA